MSDLLMTTFCENVKLPLEVNTTQIFLFLTINVPKQQVLYMYVHVALEVSECVYVCTVCANG